MSDILIKNMEIPKDYKYVDVRIFRDGTATTSTAEEPFYKRMDVIELPPHGDLIDKTALLNHMTNVHKEWQEHPDQHKSIITIIDDELIVDFFPAIIKAEGTKE